ncbi:MULTISPECIES: FeoA family protein [unclassified Helicobacter]|uniref:FeoA family protein n=1 Tax=unclassified Helicobacter TaxID=2593540 RepID=UPI000CF0B3ED|nr:MULTISPECIES: FeoA family protein [unclassified Helicobacter]
MKLTEAIINTPYKITQINNEDKKLLDRLLSFGITKGSVITPIHYSAKKSTLAIKIQNSQIALRYCEAHQIQVELFCND